MRQAIIGFAGLSVALLFTAARTAAAVQVSVPGLSAAPSSSVVIPVTCSSPDVFASGIQFDLSFDSSAMSVSATAGDAARNSGKGLYFADVASGQKRFIIVGLNQDSIPDGTLVNLFVNLNSAAVDSSYRLVVFNVVGADANGQAIAVTASSGELSVLENVGPGSRLSMMGVLNGASLLPGPVAPGEIVTLIGAGIGPVSPQQPAGSATSAVLGGTSVLFDGIPSPILYAAPNQVNLVIPYEVYGKPATQLRVAHRDRIIAALSVSVADKAPAVFTRDASGVGPGAILNQDGTINTPANPAEKGSAVVLFATGAGQTDPPGTDGQIAGHALPKPLLPVSVRIDNLDAQVFYEGAAPTLVAGVLQVNCIVPANARSGYAVPVVLTVGNVSSPSGVTLAVK